MSFPTITTLTSEKVESETTTSPVPETVETVKPQVKIENAKMVTVDQVASERFMMALDQTLEEISKFNEYTDDKINKHLLEIEERQKLIESYLDSQVNNLENLNKVTQALESQINTAGSYSNYLEQKVKADRAEADVSALTLSLNQEREKISKTLNELEGFVQTKINVLEAKTESLKSSDDILKQTADGFANSLKKTVDEYVAKASKELFDQTKDAFNTSQNNIVGVKQDTKKLLEELNKACQNNLDTMHKSYIAHLESTKQEHEALIKKIPEVKKNTKLNNKDILIILLSIMNFVSFFMRFKQ